MRLFAPIAALLALFAWIPPAHAEVFHDGEVLRAGKFRLGFEPQITFGPERTPGEPFIGFTRFGFGIGKSADMEFTAGFFEDDTYFGLDVQFQMLRDGEGYPALSFTAGAHFWYNDGNVNRGFPGLDGSVILSEDIRDIVVLFMGIDTNVEFRTNRVEVPIRAVLGADIEMSRHLHLLFEVGYGLLDSPHHISGGPAILF